MDRFKTGRENTGSPESLGIRYGDRVIGIVASVRPVKDHATFLRSAALVLKKNPKTVFLVVGWQDSATVADARALAHELGIESRVVWVGAVENPFPLLRHFDIGVLSSKSEGFSNALLEYGLAAVATVATDVGGVREIVQNGRTGLLVPPSSPNLMAEAIARLLHDEDLRRTLGENARSWVTTTFGEEKILGQYSELYLNVVAGRKRKQVFEESI
jgi:glycosyltransferase involved in cell wall biosynthesis